MKSIKVLTIEGNEGTGKTVLSKAFAEKIGAYWTHEPNGETEMLKSLRKLALTQNPELTDRAREMLMMANRSIHNKNIIEPLINKNIPVVSDRSFFSGMVYANIAGMSFEEWFDLFKLAKIKHLPEVLIYVRNSDRRIVKENDNIYDHASEETLKKIDLIYENGLQYIQEHKDTRGIKVISFDNNFNLSVDKNVDNLLTEIKLR